MPVEIRELVIQAQVGQHSSDSPVSGVESIEVQRSKNEEADFDVDELIDHAKEEIMKEMKQWVKEYFRQQKLNY